MQLHCWVGLFCDHPRQGKKRCFEGAMNGELVQFVQREVHEFGEIAFDR